MIHTQCSEIKPLIKDQKNLNIQLNDKQVSQMNTERSHMETE